jgi:hypothetical protein
LQARVEVKREVVYRAPTVRLHCPSPPLIGPRAPSSTRH